MSKELIFHIGLPKTGSTALQTYLARNTAFLLEQGISYPFVKEDPAGFPHGCQGNAALEFVNLAKIANKQVAYRDRGKTFFPDMVKNAVKVSETNRVLISAEELSRAELIEDFHAISKEFKICCIAFVRDPYDITLSTWKEHVKSLGLSLTISGLIDAVRRKTYASGLARVAEFVRSGLDVRLISYDAHKTNIIPAFLKTLAVQFRSGQDVMPKTDFQNPSLSFEQANLITMAHQITGSSLFASTLLDLSKKSLSSHKDPVIAELDQAILDGYGQDISLLNNLLTDTEKLRTTPRKGVGKDSVQISRSGIELIMSAVAKFQIHGPRLPFDFDPAEYLRQNPDVDASGMEAEDHYLLHGHREGRCYKASGPNNVSKSDKLLLPVEFDGQAYLLHNQDVAEAGLDPEYHYLTHGRWEGRVYKWT